MVKFNDNPDQKNIVELRDIKQSYDGGKNWIIRSLLANSNILLMDEPFGALDIKTRLHMQDLLTSIWRKFQSTIIFVTHDIAEAVYLADDIYILQANPGQVAKHIHVDLPLVRDRTTKRDPRFIELVHKVEDAMIELTEVVREV